jgi:hypothetical protein
LEWHYGAKAQCPPDRTGRELKKYILTSVVRAGHNGVNYLGQNLGGQRA